MPWNELERQLRSFRIVLSPYGPKFPLRALLNFTSVTALIKHCFRQMAAIVVAARNKSYVIILDSNLNDFNSLTCEHVPLHYYGYSSR